MLQRRDEDTKSEYYNQNFYVHKSTQSPGPSCCPKNTNPNSLSNREVHRQACAYNGLHLPLSILSYTRGSITETQTKRDLAEISGNLKSSSWAAVTGNLLSKMAITRLSHDTFLGKCQLHAQELVLVQEVWVMSVITCII